MHTLNSTLTSAPPRLILCAVTFSFSARAVIEHSAALAARHDGELRLFHVLDPIMAFDEWAQLDEALEHALGTLDSFARHVPPRVRVSIAVTVGDAAADIVQHANLLRADLVAVGMTGRDGMPSAIVTDIARTASCPVLVVDPGVRGAGPRRTTCEELLCATDGGPGAFAAADYAMALAQGYGARLTMVHVVPDQPAGVADPPCWSEGSQALPPRSGAHPISTIVVSGEPASGIAHLASVLCSDFIVTGVDDDDRSCLESTGTIARLLQLAPCPVILVPPPVHRRRPYIATRGGYAM